jgi:GMC oxidoreductase/FAD binding domain-containing protein
MFENDFDVCVVGAGPVGMAAAIELGERGMRVALIESGSANGVDGAAQALAEQEVVDPKHHAPSSLTVRRGLGGTSATWSGRCVPFDPIDFQKRDWVPEGRWPIGESDVRPFYQKAATFLDCGDARFWDKPTFRGAIDNGSLERWSSRKNVAVICRERLQAARSVSVYTGLTVTGLVLNDSGEAATGVRCVITSGGEPRTISADRIILAAGGIECTRLLLTEQRAWPQKFGGTDGPLGRYYMDHTYGRISDVVFNEGHASAFDFVMGTDGVYTRRRISFSAEMQCRRKLLNTVFMPDSPLFCDHARRDGALSALFLAMACRPIGRRFLQEAIRLQQIGPAPRQYLPHVMNILRSPIATVRDVARILYQRYSPQTTKPGLYCPKTGTYPLYFHGEHSPNRDSRVTLSSQVDALGLPRAKVDIRFSAQDIRSVVAAHEALDENLRAKRIGRLTWHNPGHAAEDVSAQTRVGFHQIGVTRMSSSPRDGVVNSDCRVHDLHNIYVVGSAVFPTSGQANPTFQSVALAVRLAATIQARRAITPASRPLAVGACHAGVI